MNCKRTLINKLWKVMLKNRARLYFAGEVEVDVALV